MKYDEQKVSKSHEFLQETHLFGNQYELKIDALTSTKENSAYPFRHYDKNGSGYIDYKPAGRTPDTHTFAYSINGKEECKITIPRDKLMGKDIGQTIYNEVPKEVLDREYIEKCAEITGGDKAALIRDAETALSKGASPIFDFRHEYTENNQPRYIDYSISFTSDSSDKANITLSEDFITNADDASTYTVDISEFKGKSIGEVLTEYASPSPSELAHSNSKENASKIKEAPHKRTFIEMDMT